jgi:hypothetical protein
LPVNLSNPVESVGMEFLEVGETAYRTVIWQTGESAHAVYESKEDGDVIEV